MAATIKDARFVAGEILTQHQFHVLQGYDGLPFFAFASPHLVSLTLLLELFASFSVATGQAANQDVRHIKMGGPWKTADVPQVFFFKAGQERKALDRGFNNAKALWSLSCRSLLFS